MTAPRSNQNDPVEKFVKHLKKNRDAYLTGATLVGVFALGRWSKKTPTVDETKVVAQWMQRMVAKEGMSIYALTPEQSRLWESTWDYALKGAEIFNMTPSEAIAKLTKTQLYSVEQNFENLRAIV